MKMDWLRLESRVRSELSTVAEHNDTRDFALILQAISDVIGEETGRGHILPENWWRKFEPPGPPANPRDAFVQQQLDNERNDA